MSNGIPSEVAEALARYVDSSYVTGVGGGEDAAIVTLKGGAVLVFAFGFVGLYRDIDHYIDGEDAPIGIVEIESD